jgi:hypothetical protein
MTNKSVQKKKEKVTVNSVKGSYKARPQLLLMFNVFALMAPQINLSPLGNQFSNYLAGDQSQCNLRNTN